MRSGGRLPVALLIALTACGGEATGNTTPPDDAELSGGAATVFDATSAAFSHPAPNLTGAELELHTIGDEAFDAQFVTAPAPVNPGLGPFFSNRSCAGCHTSDGRGRPPVGNEPLVSMLFRLSLAGAAPDGGPLGVPGYGLQLQSRAIQGVTAEGDVDITYHDSTTTLGDGTPYSLRVPTYTLVRPYTALPGGLLLSPRVAPPNFGLGLLEAIPESAILANGDEQDANHDGISGRANRVTDAANGGLALGRFGLKANVPNLVHQSAGAYNGDMGITTPLFAGENCAGQTGCVAAHAPEVTDSVLAAVVFYIRTLGVPARRLLGDPATVRGEQVFGQIGCAKCHVATFTTGSLAGIGALGHQRIHPYTDLLLHDMGPGLADGRPDFVATGSEWRTAPLWGIGLTRVVNGHTNFLHDGRARDILEAILWHGGEAETAREAVRLLSPADRGALLRFIESL